MKETITNKEMWDYIHQYYGYGCVDAPVYLIGQEEGGGNIDYRYDRFIKAVPKKTCIDIDNPIDKNYKIRTLDGSAFHKVIRRLEKKDALVKKIVTKFNININNQITEYINYNNESDRALTIEIDDLYKKIKKEFPNFLLDERRFRTSLTDETWLYSGNIETEMTQNTFTPIVTHIISPLYKCLYNKNEEFKEKEFQATQMARINSKYPLFVSELYPIACKDLETWDIKKFCPTFADKDRYRSNIAKNRALCIKKLIQTVKVPPKVVIMYGGIGDDDFNPSWDEIAGEPEWKTIPFSYIQRTGKNAGKEIKIPFYISKNNNTVFIKISHPTAKFVNADDNKYYRTVFDYLKENYLDK